VELVLAVLVTRTDIMRSLFGTAQLSLTQWALALVPAVALFFLWEIGKLIARHGTESAQEATPAEAAVA
jgi:Ca2+-transporting ATPase